MPSTEPIKFKGCMISPLEFLCQVITPQLKPQKGETDICVMWNSVTESKNGKKTRINYYMWEGADTRNKISAIWQVTALTESIASMMLGNADIKQKVFFLFFKSHFFIKIYPVIFGYFL